ncbi:hypothetical protein LLG46_09340 [bacterium]|nr:hypothetical protein [bacterium]
MVRLYNVMAAFVCILGMVGCGGGSGSSIRNSEIDVASTRSSPADTSVSQGNKVVWVNNTSSTIKIVSGTLEPVRHPTTRDISCLVGGTFSPDSLDADFGDTIVWRNMDTENSIVVEILNASNKVIKSMAIEPLMTGSYSGFSRAGKYKYRVADSTTSCSLVLYGVPTPDGKFESMYLTGGKKFSTYLFESGVQSYYIIESNSTGSSCVTAEITVL